MNRLTAIIRFIYYAHEPERASQIELFGRGSNILGAGGVKLDMRNSTAKDVAGKAGVSAATVSLVLNDVKSVSISQATRERVLKAAEELGYFPQRSVGSVPRQKRVIGIVIPTLSNLIYPAWIQEIEDLAGFQGYKTVICNTNREPEREIQCLNLLRDIRVSGILLVFSPSYPDFVVEVARKIPLVNIAEKTGDRNYSMVGLNSTIAGEIAVGHLMELGHRKIGFVSTPLDRISVSRRRRLEGVRNKLGLSGSECRLAVEIDTKEREKSDNTYEIEVGRRLGMRLLENRRVTGIIGVNDMVAIGVMTAARELGLSVPEDVSVCGFDNIFLSRVFQPSLTTVDHHLHHRAKLALDILFVHIGSGPEDGDVLRVEYEPTLIVRESSGPARG